MFLLGRILLVHAALLILNLVERWLGDDNLVGFGVQVDLFVITAFLFEHSIIK
jgi:hypothetical protein